MITITVQIGNHPDAQALADYINGEIDNAVESFDHAPIESADDGVHVMIATVAS